GIFRMGRGDRDRVLRADAMREDALHAQVRALALISRSVSCCAIAATGAMVDKCLGRRISLHSIRLPKRRQDLQNVSFPRSASACLFYQINKLDVWYASCLGRCRRGPTTRLIRERRTVPPLEKPTMKSQKKQRMGLVAAGALALGMCFAATSVNATTITASVGGVPTGADCYENFDSLPAGDAGGVTNDCHITVSFQPNGSAVTGAASGQYAAPVLSSGNGSNFGDADGVDLSQYLTAGGTSGSYAQLILPTNARYLG